MKKFFIMVSLVFLLGTALFAQIGADADKPASSQPVSSEVTALQTAYSLAKYGYANESASALIGAAEILAQTPTQGMGSTASREGSQSKGSKPGGVPEFTTANLLADGKKFAAGDKTMLAWAAEVERQASTKTRGAVGGPKYDYSWVDAKISTSYVQSFKKGQLASIFVSGDGDTDLDLYVYDENGNLIDYDEDYSDDCFVSWVPKWTGPYRLKIVNRGRVYNEFSIVTN